MKKPAGEYAISQADIRKPVLRVQHGLLNSSKYDYLDFGDPKHNNATPPPSSGQEADNVIFGRYDPDFGHL